jgi:hypothetical protein
MNERASQRDFGALTVGEAGHTTVGYESEIECLNQMLDAVVELRATHSM